MKKKTTILSVMLAAAVLTMTIPQREPAYGSSGPETVLESEVVFDEWKEKKEVETELVGNIEVAIISVILPSDVDFTVDPEAEFNAKTSPSGQITSPASLAVTNNSVVPVRLEIAEVREFQPGDMKFAELFPEGPGRSFKLVDRIADAEQPGTAILVLGRKDQVYASDADFEQYAICPGKTGIPVTEMAAEETVELCIYGKAAADFYGAYEFTVRPTLKISTVRSS